MASGELQGWYPDPFGLHEKRYISAGRPTKLVRDGQVDSYDEPPSSAYVPAAEAADKQDFAPAAAVAPATAAARGGYTAVMPRQATVAATPATVAPTPATMAPTYVGDDPRVPDPPAWSPWRSAGRAIMAVVVIATAAILTVVAIGGGSAQPPWAKALGAEVTVDAPASASPGHGSPGAAVSGLIGAVEAKSWAAFCEYAVVPGHDQCPDLSILSSGTSSLFPALKNIALGYIATDGNEALVGTTGTYCAANPTSECHTNQDPAAILSSGRPFSTLWTDALSNSANAYALIPCFKQNGEWYAT
jgi:hypothetical protein